MGESRGGEGRAAGPTVINLLSSILRQYRKDGREIGRLTVRRTTEGVCSLEVQLHGEPEPEEVIFFGYEDTGEIQSSTPIGDNNGKSRGR